MSWRRVTLPAIFLLLFIVGPATAQPASPEREILRKTGAAYRSLQSHELLARLTMVVSAQGRRQTLDATLVMAGERPGRLHDELQHPQQGVLKISDGLQTWTYLPALGQYTRQGAPAAYPGDADSAALAGDSGQSASLIYAYGRLDQGVTSARLLAEETLPFEGRTRPCHVIEVAYAATPATPGVREQPRRYWIDRERFLVLKQQIHVELSDAGTTAERKETLTFTRIRLNTPVADSLFAFRAPAGAREVARFEAPDMPGEPDLSGKVATDFTLKDLGGRTHNLKRLRGKVVLLDFWATWCGPCRIQMPNVEKLHQEFKNKGLVVYAINQREPAERARGYIAKHKYTTTTLLDTDGRVGGNYQVNGIPSLVVIDRQGKIAAHFIGVRDEATLRGALKKAGIQ